MAAVDTSGLICWLDGLALVVDPTTDLSGFSYWLDGLPFTIPVTVSGRSGSKGKGHGGLGGKKAFGGALWTPFDSQGSWGS